MDNRVRAFIPIRSFEGMTRLEGSMERSERRRLITTLARRTVMAAKAADTTVNVITSDPAVRHWAEGLDVEWVAEAIPGDLDTAAAAGVAAAQGDPWLIIHGDLPAVGADDIRTASEIATSGTVLAPSHDGGTPLIGGTLLRFPFRYGPGSFRRHLTAIRGRATVLVRPGLALDLDRSRDVNAFRRLGYLSARTPVVTNSGDRTDR